MAKTTDSMAKTTTLRVSTDVRDRINQLRRTTNSTVSQVITQALDRMEEAHFWEQFDEAAEIVASDPVATEAEKAEREAWDRTLRDGLDE